MIIVTVFWMVALGFMLCMRASETGIRKSTYIKSWSCDLAVILFLYTMSVIGIKLVAILMLVCFMFQYGRVK